MSAVPEAPIQLQFPTLVTPVLVGEPSLDERFAAFHDANPQVYIELRRLALDAVRRGSIRLSIGMLYEVARWSAMTTRGDDHWKLDNSYRSRYARLLADSEPELSACFTMRELRT